MIYVHHLFVCLTIMYVCMYSTSRYVRMYDLFILCTSVQGDFAYLKIFDSLGVDYGY